jgi:hypothetical protein
VVRIIRFCGLNVNTVTNALYLVTLSANPCEIHKGNCSQHCKNTHTDDMISATAILDLVWLMIRSSVTMLMSAKLYLVPVRRSVATFLEPSIALAINLVMRLTIGTRRTVK